MDLRPIPFSWARAALLLPVMLTPGCLGEKFDKHSAIDPKEETEKWWVERHAAHVEEMKKGEVDLLMIGDSITHLWENTEGTRFEDFAHGAEVWEKHFGSYRSLNLGFAGDRTEHVLWRLHDLPLDKIDPKAAVLLIGTNNIPRNNCTPQQAAEGVQAIVSKLRETYPSLKILVLHVLPRDQPGTKFRKGVDELNSHLPELIGNEKNVTLLDIGKKFLQEDGSISKSAMPDFLHPNANGYEIWAEAMAPILKEWLRE